MSTGEAIGLLFIGAMIGFFIGGFTIGAGAEWKVRSEAIERGYAEYHSVTGVWQWKSTASN